MSVQTLDIPATGAAAVVETKEVVSRDPATGEELGRATVATLSEVQAAIGRARAAQSDWAKRSYRERASVVMRARQIILGEMEEIARLISRECGKPIDEAVSMELSPTLDLMQYFARRTGKLLRPQKIDIGQYALMGRSSRIVYRPLGVIGIISPWNFPWAIPLGEVVMALMAGNAVVLKPSELTTLVGLKIGEVFKRASLPEGLLEVVAGDGQTGAALVEAGVDKIMFTGSVATGKRVMAAAAKTLTPVVLELGGKDPMIVLEDANMEVAASAAVWGAFCNSGQACASVERCYVHESIAPQFIERVVEQTRALRQATGTQSETDIGAMSSERQLSIVAEHVEEALAQGARALTGGRRAPDLSGPFYEPTVLSDVTQEMTVMREETFGPVLPVMTFKTEEEAIRLANDSQFGLTASVWTKNTGRGRRIAERIEAGTVMVNEVLYTHGLAQTPWGGLKQSGLGRTHGRLGLLELVAPQHIHVNRISFLRDMWWFGYTPQAANLFRGFARRFASGSLLQTSVLMPQMLRRLFGRRR
jgi:succinate-semialdehyde dehydrogenase/glutarate-semialdehyde dehydrogenase